MHTIRRFLHNNHFIAKDKFHLFLCLLLVQGCSIDPATDLIDDIKLDEAIQANSSAGIEYEVSFSEGIPHDLHSALKDVSKLLRLSLNRPSSHNALFKRVQRDKELFEDVTKREGYFDAIVDVKVEKSGEEKEYNKVNIIFTVNTGKRYGVHSLKFITHDTKKVLLDHDLQLLEAVSKIEIGGFVQLDEVQDAKKFISDYFATLGYVNVKVHAPFGELDRVDKNIKLTFPIERGRKARIDVIEVLGAKSVSSTYVSNRIQTQKGQFYNAKENELTREKLIKSQLFSKVKFTVIPLNDEDCKGGDATKPCASKLVTTVEEAPARSIGFGARYSTSMGVGGQAFWYHNNLFGAGERLGISFRTALRETLAQLSFDVPDVFGPENILSTNVSWLKEYTKAYKANATGVELNYVFFISIDFISSIGVLLKDAIAYSHAAMDDKTTFKTRYTGLKYTAAYNSTDDLLDPSYGIRAALTISPHWDRLHLGTVEFVKILSKNSIYFPLHQNALKKSRFVFATQLNIGYLLMKDFKRAASPIYRFYTGGPNSIRSYGYQKVGAIDDNGIPAGGRSLCEFTAELRTRITEKIGLVPFFEMASVVRKGTPQLFGNEMFSGVGIGLRYYSGLGPIRFDVATPLTKRKSKGGKRIDSPYQISVSIGQVF